MVEGKGRAESGRGQGEEQPGTWAPGRRAREAPHDLRLCTSQHVEPQGFSLERTSLI